VQVELLKNTKHIVKMKKYTGEILLTKEAFEIYSQQLREERAREHGMTLEEWDKAVADMSIVQRIVQDHVSGSIQ
jgi:hypothetical protein